MPSVRYEHPIKLQDLWQQAKFRPNEAQEKAILHTGGPLYLPAGPGSGKTRVLLWRTVNLIVLHNVQPEDIYLATFTEKAALQLKEGLRALLGMATDCNGQPYDLAKMYIGTVHSLCRRLLLDRRFYPNRQRPPAPALLDELSQYLFLYRRQHWEDLLSAGGPGSGADLSNLTINSYFSGSRSNSRHQAVTHCIGFFNRLSEECVDPVKAKSVTTDPTLHALLDLYAHYRDLLQPATKGGSTDLSLIQQKALDTLNGHVLAGQVFKHVIIDEYQDTNTVQERLFFKLAEGHKNLCVVGDDDQALYRFRGATVENFVEFPKRCEQRLGASPKTIPLLTNYRSRRTIVSFYKSFIESHDWIKEGEDAYRVPKAIQAHRDDKHPAVVVSSGAPEAVCADIARFVQRLIEQKKVEDPNQIAFLFPSLKSVTVTRMKAALEALHLKVYAPRAGRFLEADEAIDLLGIYLHLLGRPDRNGFGSDYQQFHDWLDRIWDRGKQLLQADPHLARFIADRRAELDRSVGDEDRLLAVIRQKGWDLNAPYDLSRMKRALYETSGLADRTRKALGSVYFERIIEKRRQAGQPFTLHYIITRATALDWSLLDLFWRLTGFAHFKAMLDLAQSGEDEGPACNLGLLTQYLARFMDEYNVPVLTAGWLREDRLRNVFFSSYLFALYRRGESEYEDADDPFPKGRIPFITIHQAKGLEFPVVVLGNLRKTDRGPQIVEKLVRPFLAHQGEPLKRMSGFDIMRMFYVALSRAKNLLVLARYQGRGQTVNVPFSWLANTLPEVADLDLATLPSAKEGKEDLPQNYSYTADYLAYQSCPRRYMFFRRFGLVPSRSQTMLFGSLVHRTLDDLHQYLIDQRQRGAP